ncbi:MAG: sugar ABC transporter permease [Clostridia bacterium]|nr:sugar ABC transporter permease [Clostridia bacterium]
MKNTSGKIKIGPFVCTMPSLIGIIVFWFVPFVISFGYTMVKSSSDSSFVGMDNFRNVFGSKTFTQAAINTIIFVVAAVLLEFVFSTAIAIGVKNLKKYRGAVLAVLIFPMAIPSVSISYFWNLLFSENGFVRLLLFKSGHPEIDITSGPVTMVIALFIFLWKYTGFCASLMFTGLQDIPQAYYEVAEIEGLGKIKQLFSVTLVYLRPSIILVTILTFINSFKVYREIYLLYGSYPSSYVYMLQNYMNNLFESGNIVKLSTSAWIILAALLIPIVVTLYLQNKFSKDFY